MVQLGNPVVAITNFYIAGSAVVSYFNPVLTQLDWTISDINVMAMDTTQCLQDINFQPFEYFSFFISIYFIWLSCWMGASMMSLFRASKTSVKNGGGYCPTGFLTWMLVTICIPLKSLTDKRWY